MTVPNTIQRLRQQLVAQALQAAPPATAPAPGPKLMFSQDRLEHILSHAWIDSHPGSHICQNCKTVFTAPASLACQIMGLKYQKTLYFCPDCGKTALNKQVTKCQELIDGQPAAFTKTKPVYEMDPAELVDAFKRLPAKTLLGFFKKALYSRHGNQQHGSWARTPWGSDDEKIASLPPEVQDLIAGSSPGIIQAAFDCCRYTAFEPGLFAKLLLELFRARSKRDLSDKLDLPPKTPAPVIEAALLKLKPSSRLRILKQLKVKLPNLEPLIFPLLMHRTLRPKATEILMRLADEHKLDKNRIAAALSNP